MEQIFELIRLPKKLTKYDILSRLDLNTILSIFQSCKEYSELSNNDHFWKKHVLYRYDPLGLEYFKPEEKDWKWVAQTQKRINLAEERNYLGCGTFETNSNLFIGEFVDSTMHGYGRILKKTIENNVQKYIIVIEGQFKNGIPHGKVLKFYDKAIYEGEMSNGKLEGEGKMSWNDGYQYSGQWKDGKREGEGTLTYPKGSKYVGTFVDNKKHGRGVHFYSTGEQFLSDNWKNDKVSDFDEGTFKWKNGNVYNGQFIEESQICGMGEFIEKEGFVIKGEFKKEEKSKNGIPVGYPDCLNPLMLEVLKKQKCTREITDNNTFYGQVLYSMHEYDRLFVCETCLKYCRNNKYSNKYFVGSSTCKCGTFDEIQCKMNQN